MVQVIYYSIDIIQFYFQYFLYYFQLVLCCWMKMNSFRKHFPMCTYYWNFKIILQAIIFDYVKCYVPRKNLRMVLCRKTKFDFSFSFRQGLTFFLTYAILAAVLGMLQFGYNTGVINAPQNNIEYFIKSTYRSRYGEELPDEVVRGLYSVAVSIFAIGGMVGGFVGGTVANKFGRWVSAPFKIQIEWKFPKKSRYYYLTSIFSGKEAFF